MTVTLKSIADHIQKIEPSSRRSCALDTARYFKGFIEYAKNIKKIGGNYQIQGSYIIFTYPNGRGSIPFDRIIESVLLPYLLDIFPPQKLTA